MGPSGGTFPCRDNRSSMPCGFSLRKIDAEPTARPGVARSQGVCGTGSDRVDSPHARHEVRTCLPPHRQGRGDAADRPGVVHDPGQRSRKCRRTGHHARASGPLDAGAPGPDPPRSPRYSDLRARRRGARRRRIRDHRRGARRHRRGRRFHVALLRRRARDHPLVPARDRQPRRSREREALLPG